MANELLMTFYPPVNANVANQFDNYHEKKLHAHFWLWKAVVLYLIDDITVEHVDCQPSYFSAG